MKREKKTKKYVPLPYTEEYANIDVYVENEKIATSGYACSKGIEVPQVTPVLSLQDYLYIYTGSMDFINAEGILFERGVPTFLHKELHGKFNKNDFKPYSASTLTRQPSLDILVRMPNTFEYFISALTSLRRIKDAYPTNTIQVTCRDELVNYLPEYVTRCTTVAQRYYREFKLTNESLESYWLTIFNQTIIPRHVLILQSTGLYIQELDKDIKPAICDNQIEYTLPISIIQSEDQLYKNIQDTFSCEHILSSSPFPQHLLQPRGIVSTGDTPLLYHYLYMGVPLLLFMEKSIQKHQFQYKQYKNVQVFAYPDNEERMKVALETVRSFINEYQ